MILVFADLDPGISTVPDESSIARYRQLMETHQLDLQFLAQVNLILSIKSLLLRHGAGVDIVLIAGTARARMQMASEIQRWI